MKHCHCTACQTQTKVLPHAPGNADCCSHEEQGDLPDEDAAEGHETDCSCGVGNPQARYEEAHGSAPEDSHESCGCADSHSQNHCHQEHAVCDCSHQHDHQDDDCGCGHSHGERDTTSTRRDIIAIVISAAVAAVGILAVQGVAQTVLMLLSILIVGTEIFKDGLRNIAKLDLEERALMTIAVVAACLIGEYTEALLVTLLFRVGGILEDLAVARSRRAVEAVTKIIPERANLLLEDGSSMEVEAESLLPGSRILVKSGERFPADGVILEGTSSVDESSLTGESIAREIFAGEKVLSGSINLGGVLVCETTSAFADSTASRIVEMVRESAAQKGQTERLISRFARVYTPIVIVLAVLVSVLPPLFGAGTFSLWLSRALVFLVASCPCALVIAVPLSYFAGIGAASKQGILIKGSRYMEALAAADTIVFDKTGTLTTGKLRVGDVIAIPESSTEEVLRLSAALESFSNHPIAKAVVEAAGGADRSGISQCEEITAHGMRAELDGMVLLCGSIRLMQRERIDVSGLPEGSVYLARDGKALGVIRLADTPRAEAAEAIAGLRREGIALTAMLTGDSPSAANQVAKEVGVDKVSAGLLPADKVEEFVALRSKTGKPALFVGDGINDSPVLARADAGIAVGMAADAAIEAADVVLLSDKLTALPQAIRIAKKTGRLARVNIIFALAVKLLVFVLAVTGQATMWMAVFADVGVTILTVLNATRALRFR